VHLKDHDLRQLDAERLHRLRLDDPEALEGLSVRLLEDLKDARERLSQNPDNSSRPPSTRDPWQRNSDEQEVESKIPVEEAASAEEPAPEVPASAEDEPKEGKPSARSQRKSPRKPGKQVGAPGHARTQTLAIDQIEHHRPETCGVCQAELSGESARCYTGFETVDLVPGELANPGLQVLNIKHLYYETRCERCGHVTRQEPYRAPPQGEDWGDVELSEWRLIGPFLAALLSFLHFRLRLSARHCREFSLELFALSLSVGAIQQSFHESARACEPVMEQLNEELKREELLYGDETPHKQAGEPLWLWVALGLTTVIFFIGRRTKETFWGHIGLEFAGWLMADGYGAYRDHALRLRCWAHLIRKARALAEGFTPHVQGYGLTLLEILDTLMAGVYQAREGPPVDLRSSFSAELARLKALCTKMARSSNEKARQLGVEFLNDWEAIFRVLEHPHLPLTNNVAERILRHWVILRRITQGTRTEQGSKTLAIMASVIETCRLRNASPLRYLAQTIAARRKGLEVPPIPVAA
jgi:transposase